MFYHAIRRCFRLISNGLSSKIQKIRGKKWIVEVALRASFVVLVVHMIRSRKSGMYHGNISQNFNDSNSLRSEWEKVILRFIGSISTEALNPEFIEFVHAKNKSHACALVKLQNGVLTVNSTGLHKKYIQGRFSTLELIVREALSRNDKLKNSNFTVMVDVSDGSYPFAATFVASKHWNYQENAVPVPLGSSRGIASGIGTPVLGWDRYTEQFFRKSWDKYPWETKIKRAIFRGALRMQRYELGSCNLGAENCKKAKNWKQINRGVLYTMANGNNDTMDVAFTSIQSNPWSTENQLEGAPEPTEVIDLLDYQKFKIVICVGSNQDWAERMRGLMFMNSVVAYHVADVQEFFTPLLRPWFHFVPFSIDMSDLVQNLRMALDNDDLLKRIQINQREFSERYLSEDAMIEYWNVLLQAFSEKQSYHFS